MPAPACWTPPARLPDLPPGEAVRAEHWEVFGARARFPPPSAPGFSGAARAGLLPPPAPPHPPVPVPGLSSWSRLRLGLLLVLGGAGLGFALAGPDGVRAVITTLLAAVVVGAGGWCLWSTGARDQVELAAGYTSGRTFLGLWRLGRGGRVLREPDRSVPPPGWYPSPYFPGVLQRWEGPGWAPLTEDWWKHEEKFFRRPAVPFL